MAEGKIIAISISEKKGQKKHNIESANLIVDHGMEGDAHAGNWHRQISLLGIASIDHMRAQGADVKPGDFAEKVHNYKSVKTLFLKSHKSVRNVTMVVKS